MIAEQEMLDIHMSGNWAERSLQSPTPFNNMKPIQQESPSLPERPFGASPTIIQQQFSRHSPYAEIVKWEQDDSLSEIYQYGNKLKKSASFDDLMCFQRGENGMQLDSYATGEHNTRESPLVMLEILREASRNPIHRSFVDRLSPPPLFGHYGEPSKAGTDGSETITQYERTVTQNCEHAVPEIGSHNPHWYNGTKTSCSPYNNMHSQQPNNSKASHWKVEPQDNTDLGPTLPNESVLIPNNSDAWGSPNSQLPGTKFNQFWWQQKDCIENYSNNLSPESKEPKPCIISHNAGTNFGNNSRARSMSSDCVNMRVTKSAKMKGIRRHTSGVVSSNTKSHVGGMHKRSQSARNAKKLRAGKLESKRQVPKISTKENIRQLPTKQTPRPEQVAATLQANGVSPNRNARVVIDPQEGVAKVIYIRPRGRSPLFKSWDYTKGVWAPKDQVKG